VLVLRPQLHFYLEAVPRFSGCLVRKKTKDQVYSAISSVPWLFDVIIAFLKLVLHLALIGIKIVKRHDGGQ